MSQTCTNCRATLQDSETFCRNCGTLTGLSGPDPTLIIRRPSPDASSPWARVGAQFATSPGRAAATGAPVTVGAFVNQVPPADMSQPANRIPLDERTRSPLDVENNAERTRIVRKHQGLPMLKGWLVAIGGPERGESWTIRHGKNSIGRTQGADILLHEDSISSSHAVLWLGENDSATLVDRDSSNGTFVDGRQVFQPTEIPDDALIRCGEITTLQWVRFHPKQMG
ncbi:MAG: FHA domain-containing protein [Betaproteobacteria bacterium]|nr:FHA domain-containing protein [Betaproteobacteria bacterium]